PAGARGGCPGHAGAPVFSALHRAPAVDRAHRLRASAGPGRAARVAAPPLWPGAGRSRAGRVPGRLFRAPARRARACPGAADGARPPALALAAYQRACFGSAWAVPYTYSNAPAYRALHHHGLLGLTHPSARNFYEGFLAPQSGLFALSPWLLLGVAGMVLLLRAGKARAETLVCAGVLAVGLLFLASLELAAAPWHGWEIGPRYVAIAVPFVALPAAALFGRAIERPGLAVLAGGLLLCSCLLYTGASLVMPLWPDKLHNPLVE